MTEELHRLEDLTAQLDALEESSGPEAGPDDVLARLEMIGALIDDYLTSLDHSLISSGYSTSG